MKRALLALALLVAFSGCMEKGPSAEDLKAMMVESVRSLDTYRFSMGMTQNIEIINRSTVPVNITKVVISSSGDGAVNLPGRAMGISQTSRVRAGDGDNATSMESQTYFINDTIYMMLGGNWTRLKLPNADQLWDRQNMVKHQVELLNSSKLEMMGSENVDGQDCYKVRVVPDMYTYAAVLSEQMGSSMPLAYLNITELYRRGTMDWTSWITKDKHFFKKYDLKMGFIITPETMGQTAMEMGDLEMRVQLNATIDFKDYNAPVAVKLPEKAEKASPLAMLPMMVGQPEQ
jgi:hypothetical protein